MAKKSTKATKAAPKDEPIVEPKEEPEAAPKEEPIAEPKSEPEQKAEGGEDLEAEIMADLEDLDSGNAPSIKPKTEPTEVQNAVTETPKEEPIEGTPAGTGDAQAPAIEESTGEEATNAEPAAELSAPATPAPAPSPVSAEQAAKEFLAESEGEEAEGEEVPPIDTEAQAKATKVDARVNMRNIIEAALFVAGRPLSYDDINAKTNISKKDLEALLNELMMDYMERPTALEILQIQDKFSLQIKPEYTPSAKKFTTGGLIPEAILKTLTIIALKQPLLKSTLIKLRGAGAYDHTKFLLDRGFVKSVKKGRSDELMTTEQFSNTFGLSTDLTTLKKQLIAQLGIPEG